MKRAKKLIVFFIPGDKLVNGGILSIFSIAKVSREFKNIHGAEVVISVLPGAKSYGKNDLFENNETIYSFEDILDAGPYESLLLHIPEFGSYNSFMYLKKHADFLANIPDFRVNIMLQNILLMQPPHEVALWFSLTPQVTQTTAHNKYSTQELADKYAIPTHHLSTFVDSHQYTSIPVEQKDRIIALSPDQSKLRAKIEKRLRSEVSDYKIVTIENMKYEDYKKFIVSAKYIVTFGEGFDGYYVEGFFTGGITFAVYNTDFFPDRSFAKFLNTYESEAELADSIVSDIIKLDSNDELYKRVNKENLDRVNSLYSYENYRNNIKLFYKGRYKLMPSSDSHLKLLADFITASEIGRCNDRETIQRLKKAVHDMEKMIADKSKQIEELDDKILNMEQSKSWRLTKPLRKASSALGQKS